MNFSVKVSVSEAICLICLSESSAQGRFSMCIGGMKGIRTLGDKLLDQHDI